MSVPAPLRAIGNLRLTPHGAYADYLLSGQPFIFLSEEWQDRVAAEHAELWRALPSGSSKMRKVLASERRASSIEPVVWFPSNAPLR